MQKDNQPPYQTNHNHIPYNSVHNYVLAIQSLGLHIWRNEFDGYVYIGDKLLDDTRVAILCEKVSKETPLKSISPKIAWTAIYVIAEENKTNPQRDWIMSLEWDGKPRVESFFTRYLETPYDAAHRQMSVMFMCQLAAKLIDPTIKCERMLVLIGNQEIGKSLFCEAIVPHKDLAGCAEGREEFGNLNFMLLLRGKLIVEVNEMGSFNKADYSMIKSLITVNTDEYRSPYGRSMEKHARTCVFVGTSNHENIEFLPKQAEGTRRFMPIHVPTNSIDLDAIRSERSQLFAEARDLVMADRKILYRWDNAIMENIIEGHKESSILDDLMTPHVDQHEYDGTNIFLPELFTAIGFSLEHVDKKKTKEAVAYLRSRGYTRKDIRTPTGVRKGWVKQK